MPNIFDDLDAAVTAAVADVFGDMAVIHPRLAASEYSNGQPDGTRPQRTVTGIFSSGPDTEKYSGQSRSAASSSAARSTQSCTFWLSAVQLATVPYAIAKGDRIVISDRPAETYKVSAMHPTDMGDIEFLLTIEEAT